MSFTTDPKPCGTAAAYWRHKYHGEVPCPEDVEAHNRQKREWTHRKGIHRPVRSPRHGTNSRYQVGCRCDACLAAHAEAQRDWRDGQTRKRQKQRERAWTTRDAILDWLHIDGGWLTSEGMAAELGRNREVIDRILRRLRSEGRVESRVVELAFTPGGYDQRTEWKWTG